MKREIKFRAWDNIRHKMHFNVEEGVDLGVSVNFACILRTSSEMIDFDVMQFTGLKDKNGKDIYEWDIVQKWHYNKKKWIAIVEHIDYIDSKIDGYKGKNVSGFYLVNDDWDYPNEEFVDIEVIGNIYENPELL